MPLSAIAITRKKVKVKSLSRVRLFATPWTVGHQAPPSMGFSRQEYWSGMPFPSPGDLPDSGIKPRSPALQADALTSEPPGRHNVQTVRPTHFSCSVLGTLINPHQSRYRATQCHQKGSSYHFAVNSSSLPHPCSWKPLIYFLLLWISLVCSRISNKCYYVI